MNPLLISIIFFSGSLGTSVFDSDVSLVGASGGVYALLAAHLANILLVSKHSVTFIQNAFLQSNKIGVRNTSADIGLLSAAISLPFDTRHN